MIPTYNCSKYLKQTLEKCALTRTLGSDKMQIEVVDDGSTDADVSKLVAEIGKGE
jgi:glycosyltransferase involved in cell wall biosynthesis